MKFGKRRYDVSTGEMRNIITLLIPTQTVGERGNVIITYPTETDVYARVSPGGNERALQAANLTYNDILTVIIRYQSTLANNWKIRYNNKDYTIHQVTNIDGVNRFQQILAYNKTP